MNRSSSRAAVSLATLVALAAFACSSATPDSGLPDSKGPSTPSKTKAPAEGDDDDTTTDTSPATPSEPEKDTNTCGTKATSMECGDCCIAKKPAAWEAADDVFFDCLCAPSACATACAESVCATAENQNEPTAACNTCLDAQEPACDDKATAACDADADCKAIEACLTTSCDPIADKEDQAGGGGGGGNGASALPGQLIVRATKASYRRR